MEGSSESGWPKSGNAKGLNTTGVSDSTRSLPLEQVGISDNTSLGVGFSKLNDKKFGLSTEDEAADPFQTLEWGDANLRQWLDKPERSLNASESLHIFKQIVELVNVAHSQGIVVHNVRPSCFVMSSLNRVSFIESASCSDSGSDSIEDGWNKQIIGATDLSSTLPHEMLQSEMRLDSEDFQRLTTTTNPVLESSFMQLGPEYIAHELLDENEEIKSLDHENFEKIEEKNHPFPMKEILVVENSWYISPEEDSGDPITCASDIYRLGVLLFELFCPFCSREEKITTMSSLRHRVLPPRMLLKYPKEASFCLWLLHPEPSCRPNMGELLQSDFLNEPRDSLVDREAAIELQERIDEQELLLEFLLWIQQRKKEAAEKLQDALLLLRSDIKEVSKQHTVLTRLGNPIMEDHAMSSLMNVDENKDSSSPASPKRFRQGLEVHTTEDKLLENHESIFLKNSRLMKNLKKLETVYYLTRCRPARSSGKTLVTPPVSSDARGSIVENERNSASSLASRQYSENTKGGWINPFLEGLCKYLSFSKLQVKAELKQEHLLNSTNLVCSLSFDRDGEFFAAASVSKKIKVFECDTIITQNNDIHYPVVEMSSRCKLSSICWSRCIKDQIASSDFEGVVKLWDVTQSKVITELREHEKRVWSIDYSSTDPTLLASGSDDGFVKLWNINQGASVGAIQTLANICCVQLSADGRFLAFGSADHTIYYYDLRNPNTPLCVMIGHDQTVSYVKFVDSKTLVSSSTDNTLKLWDLSTCSFGVNDTPLQSFTGHMNTKNFVGLSVSDGYIATGSETNEIFVYHKAFPMPALSFKFNGTDTRTGYEMDDAAQFISSVCWRNHSTTLLAANSTGTIKILEMV